MIYTAMLFLLILLSSQLSVVQGQRFRCPKIDNDPCEPLVTVHQISDGVCVEECRRLGLFAQVLSQWTCGVCPTASPTNSPTPNPTNRPTPNPTNRPTPDPTNSPTPNPTNRPTPNPTNRPTPNPTNRPTPNPTNRPTPNPTPMPTPDPTNRPTPNPTPMPTPNPTNRPTPNPTDSPTPNPTPMPTLLPTPIPTSLPTPMPTIYNQCSQPYNVLNETERGVDYNDGGTDYQCCDKLNSRGDCPAWQGNGWYRFMGQGGTRMPDENDPVPTSYSCGTEAPGYMAGMHPAVEDGIVSRQVCFNFIITCVLSININVVNCGDFFLYELVEEGNCPLAFCATNAPLRGM